MFMKMTLEPLWVEALLYILRLKFDTIKDVMVKRSSEFSLTKFKPMLKVFSSPCKYEIWYYP